MSLTAKHVRKETESRAVVDRVWTDVVNGRDLSAIDELVSEDYIYHGPGGYELAGPEGFRHFVAALHELFEDLTILVHEYIVENDRVLSRWTGQGRNTRTGRLVEWEGATITRVADGKMIADWEYWDRLELAAQLSTGWLERRIVDSVSRGATKGFPSE